MNKLEDEVINALRRIHHKGAPPKVAVGVPAWAVIPPNDLVPESRWKLTPAGEAVVALADERDAAIATAQVRGWVDAAVDEPPEGVHVLTLTADGETQILYLDDDGDWYSAMTGSWWDGSPVEMWHDLPELPPDAADVEHPDDADDL